MNKKIKFFLPKVKENILLSKYNTFKIGGKARYFFEAKNKEDLIKAIKTAKNFGLSFFILGGGSNILFSDKIFKGMIIKLKIKDLRLRPKKNEIEAGAGVSLNDLIKLTEKNNLAGLEWAAGIPGTVGGAIFGNAQSFGKKISDVIKSVEVLDVKNLKISNLLKNKCGFEVKSSIFKKNKNLIVISAVFNLRKSKREKIQEKIKEHLNYRKKNHPLNFPSAGSIFINPSVKIKDKKILEKYPEIKNFNKKKEIRAGYLIDKCGLKGKKIGRAKISEKHANIIVNLGKAKASDVLKLIKLAKQKVKKKFKIDLKEEIIIINN